jgi:hypothetical protein
LGKAVVCNLIQVGAHVIEDVMTLVGISEVLEEFKVLDRIKLEKARIPDFITQVALHLYMESRALERLFVPITRDGTDPTIFFFGL